MLAGIVILVLAAAIGGRPSLVGAESKTLTRTHDAVIVSTIHLASLPTRDTAALRLYRFDGTRATAIPMQCDPRDERGDLVVTGPPDFAFDDGDECVFMAKDTGDRAPADAWPPAWQGAVEVEVVDPRPGRGGRGWAYLAAVEPNAPPATFTPYVTFDVTARQARSPEYEVEYAPARNFFTGVRVHPGGGGTSTNLLRQSRMRGSPTFSLLVRDVSLDFTEQNSIVDVEGVRVGPVRAIRRARLTIDLGTLFPELPGGTAYTLHYRSFYVTPSTISFSWLILKALRDFRFENVLEFAPEALPLRYYDDAHPGGIVASNAEAPDLRTTDDRTWWAHSSSAGTMLHTLVIPERWRRWGVRRGTIFQEASAGYTLLDMTRLKAAGSWDVMQASIVLPTPFRSEAADDALAIVHAPLVTEVRRVL